jgi:hypothetical protein
MLGLLLGLAPVGPAHAATPDTQPAHVEGNVAVAPGSMQAVALGPDVFILSITEISSTRAHSVLTKVDPATDTVVGKLDLGLGSVSGNHGPGPLSAGAGSIWVTDFDRNVVDRVDPATMKLSARIRTGTSPTSVTVAFGSVWVSNEHDARMWRIDPSTNQVIARIQVDDPATYEHGGPYGLTHLAADGTGLLETIGSRGVVVRVSPSTNTVVATYGVSPAEDCGQVIPVAGGFWLDDIGCSWDVWHYSYATASIVGHFTTNGVGCMLSLSVIDGQAYVAGSLTTDASFDCLQNAITRLSPTGEVMAVRLLPAGPIPLIAGAWAVQSMFGDFWVESGGRHVLRIAAF